MLSLWCLGLLKWVYSEEELLQHIKTRENYPVADVYRFKRRVIKEDGMTEWVPTQTLKLTFLSQFLPDRIFIYGATANIEQYIQPIRQCNNCQNFGHIAKFCHQKPVCVNCGESHHETDCTNPDLKCKHCALKHKANDKTCPQYILQTKLINIMSEHNIPFYEARDIYQGNKTIANIVRNKPNPTITSTPFLAPSPQTNIGHFPPLKYTPPSNGNWTLITPPTAYKVPVPNNFFKELPKNPISTTIEGKRFRTRRTTNRTQINSQIHNPQKNHFPTQGNRGHKLSHL